MMHTDYGCLPPTTDVRDYKIVPASSASPLPEIYKCQHLPRVKNQGSVSSCVAHVSSSILEYHAEREGNPAKLSTAFIYGIQKKHCGHERGGMYLRDACKIVKDFGDMYEEDCAGNVEVPAAHSIAETAIEDVAKLERAKQFKINSYVKLTKVNDIKRAIMNYGPVLASVRWYDTFKCNKDDVLCGEQSGDYGYHAIMLCGWCDEGFIAQNSWGKGFGNGGRFILPYSIPVREAWQWIDEESAEIVKPVRGAFVDIVYKVVNFILNLFNLIKK